LLEVLLRADQSLGAEKYRHAIRLQLDFLGPSFSPSVRVKAECLFCQVFRDEFALVNLWNDVKFLQELDCPTAITLRQQSLDTLYALGAITETKKLAIVTKQFVDSILSRPPGIWNEPDHFSAVGHLSLLHYLLGLVDSGAIDPKCVRLVRGIRIEANKPYAEWLYNRAVAIGVTVLSPHEVSGPLESGLDLWPFHDGYVYALDKQYEAVHALEILTTMKDDSLSRTIGIGAEILSEVGWDSTKRTVTFHLQNNQGSNRALRNSDPNKYLHSAQRLVREEYNVVLLGSDFESGSVKNPAGTVTLRGLSRQELETANIALWKISEFYVGNLSGGTTPPSAFKTPTLWTDTYPISHWRPPGKRDLFLPKTVFHGTETEPLSFDRILSDEHRWSQTEDPHLLSRAGYRVQDLSSHEIDSAVLEMQGVANCRTFAPTPSQLSVAALYKLRGLEFGGFVANSFLGNHPPLLSV
jgi:putative glycosyltransferase (TIGR04372 family)